MVFMSVLMVRLERSIRLNKRMCVHTFVCNIWKGLSYFWSLEERSRDGVWSQNRGSSLPLGKRETKRSLGGGGGDSVLWMACYPAASLWLTVGLNWMSEAVSIKSTTYQLSGLKSTLLAHWSVCLCVNPWRRIFFSFGLYPSVFRSRTSES